jgi:hypothetical protein
MSDEIAHEGKLEESKQYHERQSKKRGRPPKGSVTYELVGNKVIKKEKTQSGNVFRTYVGKKKECEHLLK